MASDYSNPFKLDEHSREWFTDRGLGRVIDRYDADAAAWDAKTSPLANITDDVYLNGTLRDRTAMAPNNAGQSSYHDGDILRRMSQQAQQVAATDPVADWLVSKDLTNPKDLVGVTKCPLWLVPPAGNIEEALVFQLGAAKYGPYNWRKNPVKKSIYVSATIRHLYAMMDGEWLDPESGRPHLAHIRANTNIMLDAFVHGNLINDMDFPGDAAAMLAGLPEVKGI